jgi:hypothetical protein
LPLIAEGTLAVSQVTKLASGIVTYCALHKVKSEELTANSKVSFFMVFYFFQRC